MNTPKFNYTYLMRKIHELQSALEMGFMYIAKSKVQTIEREIQKTINNMKGENNGKKRITKN